MFFRRKKRKNDSPKVVVANCVYNCLKGKCPLYVSLMTSYTDEKTGEVKYRVEKQCAIAWIPKLLVEVRKSIDNIK